MTPRIPPPPRRVGCRAPVAAVLSLFLASVTARAQVFSPTGADAAAFDFFVAAPAEAPPEQAAAASPPSPGFSGPDALPSPGLFPVDGVLAATPLSGEGDGAEGAPAQYVEEAIRDPAVAGTARARAQRAADARLGGIPRPRYIPATDFVPPKGLILHQSDAAAGEFPFALSMSGFLQLRWLEFARGATEWTNAAGQPNDIYNINAISLNRYLIMFKGYAVDERLIYAFALFGTSNSGINTGVAPIGMAGWKFSEAATVGAGVTIVPGSREFVDPSPWTIGVDRSMANTFFRPGFSPGVASLGSLADGTLHYQAGVWNSIDAGGANVLLRRGTSMAWAGNTWWEPLAPFGMGYSDMEIHDRAAVRVGTSGVFAPSTRALPVPGFNPENTIVRLSDGTPLATQGALGGSSIVDQFNFRLATIDAGWKWRGFSANAEYYVRFLDHFVGTGPFDRPSILDQGAAGYLGWCFLPRTWEVYARSSAVTGPFGSGTEYGGGFNRYINDSRQGRLTLEALYLLHNPAQNILYPYRAGYTGTAIQTQYVVAF